MSQQHSNDPTTRSERPWMRVALALAALYNLAWGAWVVLDPGALFRWSGLEPPVYPQIWQCVGMIVGVYGVGYAIAASAPLRHWPIVLVGLLGKIFGPIGFAAALADGALPASWGWTIVTNDLVWWVPFALILLAARRARRTTPLRADGEGGPSVALALRMARTQRGESLLNLSRARPRLVVCLRHLGCSFCRETVAELALQRAAIEGAGVGIVLVHPSTDDERAAAQFALHAMDDVPRIADPARVLYRALGLSRGRLKQVLGPRVWWRGAVAAVRGHRPGRRGGDVWQMPGVFLIRDGRLLATHTYRDVAAQPDFVDLAQRAGATVLSGERRAGTRP